jgi:glutamine amidotransferase
MKKVSVINYGMGNIFSIVSACKKAGLDVRVTNDRDEILSSNAIILPGVGSFNSAMNKIKDLKLDLIISEFHKSNRPIIGICLGMQLLFNESDERGKTKGLGLIEGRVSSIDNKLLNGNKEFLNIGWNSIDIKIKNSLLNQIKNNSKFYFVHSFLCEPKNTKIVSSLSQIEGYNFCSSIKFENIEGFQFHPEKSSDNGVLVYSELKKILK